MQVPENKLAAESEKDSDEGYASINSIAFRTLPPIPAAADVPEPHSALNVISRGKAGSDGVVTCLDWTDTTVYSEYATSSPTRGWGRKKRFLFALAALLTLVLVAGLSAYVWVRVKRRNADTAPHEEPNKGAILACEPKSERIRRGPWFVTCSLTPAKGGVRVVWRKVDARFLNATTLVNVSLTDDRRAPTDAGDGWAFLARRETNALHVTLQKEAVTCADTGFYELRARGDGIPEETKTVSLFFREKVAPPVMKQRGTIVSGKPSTLACLAPRTCNLRPETLLWYVVEKRGAAETPVSPTRETWNLSLAEVPPLGENSTRTYVCKVKIQDRLASSALLPVFVMPGRFCDDRSPDRKYNHPCFCKKFVACIGRVITEQSCGPLFYRSGGPRGYGSCELKENSDCRTEEDSERAKKRDLNTEALSKTVGSLLSGAASATVIDSVLGTDFGSSDKTEVNPEIPKWHVDGKGGNVFNALPSSSTREASAQVI